MELITSDDINFLIALNASEESRLRDIIYEFEKWDCKKEDVLSVFRNLIEDGTVLLSRPIGEAFEDFTKEESLSMTETWAQLDTNELMLYLTDCGYKRWEVDDWGIPTKRARHLMFSNNTKVLRVK